MESTSNFSLAGKVALITGGGRGLGCNRQGQTQCGRQDRTNNESQDFHDLPPSTDILPQATRILLILRGAVKPFLFLFV